MPHVPPVLVLSRPLRGTQTLPATSGEGDPKVSLDAELEREQAPSKESEVDHARKNTRETLDTRADVLKLGDSL